MYVFTTLCFLACILLKVFLRSLGIVYNHLEKARNIDPDSLGEEDYIVGKSFLAYCLSLSFLSLCKISSCNLGISYRSFCESICHGVDGMVSLEVLNLISMHKT